MGYWVALVSLGMWFSSSKSLLQAYIHLSPLSALVVQHTGYNQAKHILTSITIHKLNRMVDYDTIEMIDTRQMFPKPHWAIIYTKTTYINFSQ